MVARTYERTCPSGELGGFDSYYASGKNKLLLALLTGELEYAREVAEIFYHCTLCGNCQQQCIVPDIHPNMVYWFESFREKAVELGIGPMPEQKTQADNIEKEHNPYKEPHEKRLDWLPNKVAELPKKADVVYFAGCTTSYLEKNVAKSAFEVLRAAGINFTVMPEEWCCGWPLQRTGQFKQSRELAKHNIAEIEKMGAKQVVTTCAGCYRMLKEDYKERYGLDYNFEVVHMTELLSDLMEKGKLKLTERVEKKVTYHDPCELGRWMGVYDSPRDILNKIPGIELSEMERNRENAWCCGGGGGVLASFPELAAFAADERIKEATTNGAEALVTACPACERNLRASAVRTKAKLDIFDVVELVRMAT